MRDYAVKINQTLTQLNQKIHADISLGKSTHQAVGSAPTLGDTDAGELRLRTDTVNKRLYTRIGDILYYVELTQA